MNGYLELYKLFDKTALKDGQHKAKQYEWIIKGFQGVDFDTSSVKQINSQRLQQGMREFQPALSNKNFAGKEYTHFFNKYYIALQYPGSESFTVQTVSPLLINFGIGGALETGIALHRIYGVPYIPGSALKGVAAHYAHQILGVAGRNLSWQVGGSDHSALFGTTSEAGYVQFHDALILPTSVRNCLHLDVMTPHHQLYNGMVIKDSTKLHDSKQEQEYPAPRDDDSPIPIHFMHVKGCFQIALSGDYSVSDSQVMQQWLDIARSIVLAALEQEGIGAKTNTGYGRMVQGTLTS